MYHLKHFYDYLSAVHFAELRNKSILFRYSKLLKLTVQADCFTLSAHFIYDLRD